MAPRHRSVIDGDRDVSAAEGVGCRLEVDVVVRILTGTTRLIDIDRTQARVATGGAECRIASVGIHHVDLIHPGITDVPIHVDRGAPVAHGAVVRGVVGVVPQHRIEPEVVPRPHPVVTNIGGMIADYRPIRLPDSHGRVGNHPVAVGVVESDIGQVRPEGGPVLVDVVEHRLIPVAPVEGASHLPLLTKPVDAEVVGFAATAVAIAPPVSAAAPSFGVGHIDLDPYVSHSRVSHGAANTNQKEQWQQPAPQADCQPRGFHDGSHVEKLVQDAVVDWFGVVTRWWG